LLPTSSERPKINFPRAIDEAVSSKPVRAGPDFFRKAATSPDEASITRSRSDLKAVRPPRAKSLTSPPMTPTFSNWSRCLFGYREDAPSPSTCCHRRSIDPVSSEATKIRRNRHWGSVQLAPRVDREAIGHARNHIGKKAKFVIARHRLIMASTPQPHGRQTQGNSTNEREGVAVAGTESLRHHIFRLLAVRNGAPKQSLGRRSLQLHGLRFRTSEWANPYF
jgi:hypothetical protein